MAEEIQMCNGIKMLESVKSTKWNDWDLALNKSIPSIIVMSNKIAEIKKKR